ncbi:MAG TPA: thermopsin family protease [Thermoplasmata archaeon]|nr:thermopsin family protease [Thermoplasmata archaeon]
MRLPRVLGVVALLGVLLVSGVATLSAPASGAAPSTPRAVSHVDAAPPLASSHLLPPLHAHYAIPRGSGSGVNPYAHYSAEPAPMGIADFGVDSNQNPYSYTTDEIVGSVTIGSLSAYSSQAGSYQMSIQLNVALEFSQGGSPYQYWIQDVAFLDTSTNDLTFQNNIWNFSQGSSGSLAPTGGPSGNGSVYFANNLNAYYYAAGASPSLGGANVVLSYPSTFAMRVLASSVGGLPTVRFDYSDGYGWVTYDVVNFAFASGASGVNYLVSGYNYNPIGLYDDAELVMGGPGNGWSTAASTANLSMNLAFDNGHNLQEITNGFDFGSDTGESISGLGGALGENAVNGSLSSVFSTTSGSGPASLYDRSFSAIVNISSPDAAGNLDVNSTTGVAFRGSDINLTLGPGSYIFTGYSAGVPFASVSAKVTPGEYLALRLGGLEYSRVNFTESGLPVGTRWSVALGGVRNSSTGPLIGFGELVGNYAYTVGLVNGYTPQPTAGNARVTGVNQSIAITWSLTLYSLEFTEAGLPAGTDWGVDFNGTLLSSTLNAFAQAVPNGSYSWHALVTAGYTPAPRSGVVTVSGGPNQVRIIWSRTVYSVEFWEHGLPVSTPWSVTFGPSNSAGSTTVLTFTEPNGSYGFTVPNEGGYAPSPASGSLLVAGANRIVNVTYALIEGRLVGSVTPGSAVVTVNGTPILLQNGSYAVDLPPATYTVTVSLAGYQNVTTVVVVAPGAASYLNISLEPLVSHSHPTPSGNASAGPSILLLAAVGAAVIAAIGIVAALARRRRGPE